MEIYVCKLCLYQKALKHQDCSYQSIHKLPHGMSAGDEVPPYKTMWMPIHSHSTNNQQQMAQRASFCWMEERT